MRLYPAQRLRVRVDLGVMAMKGYSYIPPKLEDWIFAINGLVSYSGHSIGEYSTAPADWAKLLRWNKNIYFEKRGVKHIWDLFIQFWLSQSEIYSPVPCY